MRYKYLFLSLILIYSKILYGSGIEEIYNPEIEVVNKELTKEQKNSIVNQELDKILLKLTGQNSVKLTNPELLVNKYEYQELPENKIILKIWFDKKSIQKKLLEEKKLFLYEDLPVTIIWPKTNSPILTDAMQGLLERLSLIAKDYGLSIIYPVLNLAEVAMLNKDPKTDDFIDLIKINSKKYNANEIIIANYDLKEDALRINWSSVTSNWQFHNQLIDNHELIDSTQLDSYANILVQNLMQHFIDLQHNQKIKQEIILLRVSNVKNLEDYINVEKYLQNLKIVDNLYVAKFSNKEVEFRIVSNGSKQSFKHALAANNWLQENNEGNSYNPNYPDNLLTYTLNL